MDLPSPGNLRLSANRILTCFIVTHSGIITCTPRYRSLRYGLCLMYSALLPRQLARRPIAIHCFGVELTPVHYRRRISRPVSCYALFKWWLLLSQHPGCHRNSTSLVTKPDFGTLADGLGCFPLDPGAYPPGTNSRDSRTGIRSLVQQSSLGRPSNRFSISTPGA